MRMVLNSSGCDRPVESLCCAEGDAATRTLDMARMPVWLHV